MCFLNSNPCRLEKCCPFNPMRSAHPSHGSYSNDCWLWFSIGHVTIALQIIVVFDSLPRLHQNAPPSHPKHGRCCLLPLPPFPFFFFLIELISHRHEKAMVDFGKVLHNKMLKDEGPESKNWNWFSCAKTMMLGAPVKPGCSAHHLMFSTYNVYHVYYLSTFTYICLLVLKKVQRK